jgi:DNA polymerase alpha-associated DNA helicase A
MFDVVIIDEAGQATEPECWIALLKGTKAILVSKKKSAE